MPIKLVANYIDATDNLPADFADSGHLQLVFNGGEMEVQSPVTRFFGDWSYQPFGQTHSDPDNTRYYQVSDRYASIDLVPVNAGQTDEQLWELLRQIHISFQTHGSDLNYDTDQNSNSYIATVLYAIGIDPTDALALQLSLAAPDIRNFPGFDRNILLDGSRQGDNAQGEADEDPIVETIGNVIVTNERGDADARGADFYAIAYEVVGVSGEAVAMCSGVLPVSLFAEALILGQRGRWQS